MVLVAALLGQGCMWFNGGELPRRDAARSIADPPVVSLEIGEVKVMHNGELRSLTPELSAESIARIELSDTLRIWKSMGLIREFGRWGDLPQDPQYTLTLTGSQNEESSTLAAFATGLSLYLFPSSTTVHYDWQFALTDLRSGTSYRVPVERSMTMWLHLLFLPAFPLGPMHVYAGHRDQAAYLYTEFEKQGAWEPHAAAAAR